MSAMTLSKAALAKHCLYPFRDDVTPPPQGAEVEGAALGTDCHGAAAVAINSKLATVPNVDDGTWPHMLAWIQANYRPTWVAEEAIAWDPIADTARILGVDINREYAAHGATKADIAGTCDVVSVEGDVVRVYEFGTGFDVSHKVEQLRLQCVAAARAHGKPRAIGQLVQFRPEGTTPWEPIELDEFELSVIAGEIAELRERTALAEPTVSGACVDLFCDVRSECPAMQEAEAQLVPEGALVRKFSTAIADPEHARWMLDRMRLVKAAMKDVNAALNTYVEKGPVELADGQCIYEGAREMPRFDSHKAIALCKQLGATEAQIASLTRPVIEGAGLRVGSKKAAIAADAKRAGKK